MFDVKSISDLGIEIPVRPQPVSVPTGINEITPGSDYLVYDGTGRSVIKLITEDNKVYLGNLSKGIYSILFSDEKSNIRDSKRIFKN